MADTVGDAAAFPGVRLARFHAATAVCFCTGPQFSVMQGPDTAHPRGHAGNSTRLRPGDRAAVAVIACVHARVVVRVGSWQSGAAAVAATHARMGRCIYVCMRLEPTKVAHAHQAAGWHNWLEAKAPDRRVRTGVLVSKSPSASRMWPRLR